MRFIALFEDTNPVLMIVRHQFQKIDGSESFLLHSLLRHTPLGFHGQDIGPNSTSCISLAFHPRNKEVFPGREFHLTDRLGKSKMGLERRDIMSRRSNVN